MAARISTYSTPELAHNEDRTQVQPALEAVASRTWVEINLNALEENVKMIRDILSPGVEILVPVKADAYGHGAVPLSKELIRLGVSRLGVASIAEGIELRRNNILVPILLLTPPQLIELKEIIDYSITPTLVDLDTALRLNDDAGSVSKIIPVHVEVDTGMGRTGVRWQSAIELLKELSRLKCLKLEGCYTHFASADERDCDYIKSQLKCFSEILAKAGAEGIVFDKIHAANSAAVELFPRSHFNLVRPGLFIYGISPFKLNGSECLFPEPVLSFFGRVVQVKQVEPGDCISYGRTFTASKIMKIATISTGYKDGYNRLLSNQGEVLIKGKRCRVVGVICMDMMMIDVTGLDVSVGDKVTLIGKDGGEQVGAQELADKIDTISYEVICTIGRHVPRIYFKDDDVVGIRSILL